MRESINTAATWKRVTTIGLDLGDRHSQYCGISGKGEVIVENRVPTTPSAMQLEFGSIGRKTIAIETGTHSPWVSRLLKSLGHQVIGRTHGSSV